jgi:Tfp pilus assembly pilus retraction ATPase PilT
VNVYFQRESIGAAFRLMPAEIKTREIGPDATSFGEALRAALRQDPDVILVGEMRARTTPSATSSVRARSSRSIR